ncbi:MAG TPA: hypothetical protein DEA96_18920 [Leptospiraceae bacterium]|nr:hypothetical protein [Spirochaetaceae bacterium]HBS07052.1 hypothetical protein [Leptospiraceae bacterium]|tara:strand:- start:5091 stop:5606 length:516 start_codon:yes stop_codon:yes gene_type:complete
MASGFFKGFSPLLVFTFMVGCASTQSENRQDDTIDLDNRTWNRRTTREPEIVFSKMVPSNEAFHSWEERIEVARIPSAISDDTIESFKERRKYELYQDCRTGTWKAIEDSPNLVIYEFEHTRCNPYEHRIVVMQRKESRGVLFIYRSRKHLDEAKVRHWINIGKKAESWNR